ncbi:MAG TPA: MFS transporter, partial [Chromatiales bacterium]|nr:MFS transporter [Chromatiales bacterium]
MSDSGTQATQARTIFPGHPAGLQTLFFTEMWERFSYYGMRALLVLFMVSAIENGGMNLSDPVATAIYGIYSASVYPLTLPGGWIADRLLGAQRSIWYGGIVIMCGHFTLAIPSTYTFFLGLLLVATGTGLLKPNISAVVGELYPPGDKRRDGGFTIFYMGINIGAFIGPLICGFLAENEAFGWHWGFAAAGIGMLFGLIQYRLSQSWLGSAGQHPSLDPLDPGLAASRRAGWRKVRIGVALIALTFVIIATGLWRPDPVAVARWTTGFIVTVAGLYFGLLFVVGGLNRDEKRKLTVIIVLFFASAMFWAGFEQAGSSLNLFAQRFTDRMIGGFEIPAAWLQSVNPILIVVLAPV